MPVLKNPRHEQFAQFIAIGKPATAAYIAAGFSPGKDGNANRGAAQSAHRLLNNPEVRARVEELSAHALTSTSKATWLNREFVLAGLRENYQRAMNAEPVMDPKGNPTGNYAYNGAVANRALELLGKELGMFQDHSNVRVIKSIEDLSKEEIDALLESHKQRIEAQSERDTEETIN